MKNHYKRYMYITNEAKAVNRSMTNKEVVQFHYFNPNGIVARWSHNNKVIAELVDRKVVKSGWHLAYGSLSDYWYNGLRDMLDLQRVSRRKLSVNLRLFLADVEKQEAKIASVLPNNNYIEV